jgi:ubiquinone/menaquinone biosynthesis C-methylase UbiE
MLPSVGVQQQADEQTDEQTDEQADEQVRTWAGMFDALAPVYDQSGVAFFGPIAAGLVERLAPRPGERAADLGCGRGAVTMLLADAVGSSGRVDALDLSPVMVELTATAAAGLDHVSVAVGDVRGPALEPAAYDLVASSLVLFFLPDPAAAVAAWTRLLRPGGRLGVTTFLPWEGTWREMEDLLASYAGPGALPAAMADVFATDAGVEDLLRRAGLEDVRTETVRLAVRFRDPEQYLSWATGTALRGAWMRVPEDRRDEALHRATDLMRTDDGLRLDTGIRYTLGTRAPGSADAGPPDAGVLDPGVRDV